MSFAGFGSLLQTSRESASKVATSLGKVTQTEATLRGANAGGFTVAQIMAKMPAILDAFRKQSLVTGYEFMKAHVPASGKSYTAGAGEKWADVSDRLKNPALEPKIDAAYFKAGNTILAGVHYHYPPGSGVEHWVVIATDKRERP